MSLKSFKICLLEKLPYLINCGIPILDSFYIFQKSIKDQKSQKCLSVVIDGLNSGQNLSSLLSELKVLSIKSISIIKIGEMSGTLSKSLENLSKDQKKKEEMIRKISGAMLYPIIVLSATLGIVSFLIFYIFPKILPIFSSMKMKLPISTKILIHSSQFIIHFWYWIIIFLIITITFCFYFFKKNKKALIYIDYIFIRIPILGRFYRSYILSDISTSISTMLESGMDIQDAFSQMSQCIWSLSYKKSLLDIKDHILKGGKLSIFISEYSVKGLFRSITLYPDYYLDILDIGERTGTLSKSFTNLSSMHEREIDQFLKTLSGLLEPILMIVMGGIVSFISLSIVSPIYSISEQLRH